MDLLEYLRTDHQFLLGLLERLDQTVTASSSRCHGEGWSEQMAKEATSLIEQMIARMATHERAEESLFFPALRRCAPELEPVVSVIEADHQGVARTFASFGREAGTAGRPAAWMILTISRLTHMVRSHIAREEADLFTAAARRIPPHELGRLGPQAEQLTVQGAHRAA